MHTKRTYTRKDTPELCKMLQNGDKDAAEIICRLNRPLAQKCASDAARIYGKCWEKDFLQEAMIGILDAAKRYDETLGAFSTYAMYYIECYIGRFACSGRYNIRIPYNRGLLMSNVNKLDGEIQELPLNQRVQKIAAQLGLSEKEVEDMLCLRYMYRHSQSLNVPINEDEELTLLESVPDEKPDAIEILVDQVTASNIVSKLIGKLSLREQRIIRLRFGFEDGECHTLEYIAKEIGVGKERIRQIIARSLRILRRYARDYISKKDVIAIAATY